MGGRISKGSQKNTNNRRFLFSAINAPIWQISANGATFETMYIKTKLFGEIKPPVVPVANQTMFAQFAFMLAMPTQLIPGFYDHEATSRNPFSAYWTTTFYNRKNDELKIT